MAELARQKMVDASHDRSPAEDSQECPLDNRLAPRATSCSNYYLWPIQCGVLVAISLPLASESTVQAQPINFRQETSCWSASESHFSSGRVKPQTSAYLPCFKGRHQLLPTLLLLCPCCCSL
jgi:hypothetical protein